MICFVSFKTFLVTSIILAGRVVTTMADPTKVQIHPDENTKKCLDVRGAIFADNTPVIIYDCNGTPAQDWLISKGSTMVRAAGTNFCLDAGTHPSDNTTMKIYTCIDNIPAQQWSYTDDEQITLAGQDFCLDLKDGILDNFSVTQIYKCTDCNMNQVWTT